MTGYRDKKGRILFVSSGISDGTIWMTVYYKPNGIGTKRLVSPALPIRKTRKEAEEDLERYARARGFVLEVL